jgi:transposase-like protein
MMKNEQTRQQLRQRIEETPRTRSGYRRYDAELKRDVVEYTLLCATQGDSLVQIAGGLGLGHGLLGKWVRHAKRRQEMGKEPFAIRRSPRPTPPHHPLLDSIASPRTGSVRPIVLLVVADAIQQSAITRPDLAALLALDPDTGLELPQT